MSDRYKAHGDQDGETDCLTCNSRDVQPYTFNPAPSDSGEQTRVWLCRDCYLEVRNGDCPRPLHGGGWV